jgi:hypothetical protein
MQMLVIVRKRLVVIIDLRDHRVSEDFRDHAHLAAQARSYLSVNVADPSALPLFLVFPVFWVTNPWFGLDVVKPCVFHPFTSGPDVFTGDGAGVATDALIQIKNHAYL